MTNGPSRHKGHLGGFRGSKIQKSLGKLSNSWTDWHRIWYTYADSSGNGHRLNTMHPSIPRGHSWEGGLGGHKFKSGEAVKRLDRLAPNLVHLCGFVWEWTSRLYNSPLNTPGGISRGFYGVTNQVWESCQTAGPIGTKFGTHLWIHLEMDIG